MSVRVTVIDRHGRQHDLEAGVSGTLMETLRELDNGVAAICGGMCSCGTCHVYVAPSWSDRLDPPHSDERDLLSELEHRRPTSRLSCQIRLVEAFDGLSVTLAPED